MEFKIQPINTKLTVYLNNGEQVTVDKNLLDALPDLLEVAQLTKLYFQIMFGIVNNSCEHHRQEMVETRTVENRTLDEVFDELEPKLNAAIAKAKGQE